MTGDRFVYVTYIRTTPDKLWAALTRREFTERYWFGIWPECDWTAGSSWELRNADMVFDRGSVVESDPPRRLVLSWRNEFKPELQAEGFSRATFELEAQGEAVKLIVTHEMDVTGSKFIAAVSTGWPMILSGLKTLLETGAALDMPRPPMPKAA